MCVQLNGSIDDLNQNGLCAIDHTRGPHDRRIDAWLLKERPGTDRIAEEFQKVEAMTGEDGDVKGKLKGEVRINTDSDDRR